MISVSNYTIIIIISFFDTTVARDLTWVPVSRPPCRAEEKDWTAGKTEKTKELQRRDEKNSTTDRGKLTKAGYIYLTKWVVGSRATGGILHHLCKLIKLWQLWILYVIINVYGTKLPKTFFFSLFSTVGEYLVVKMSTLVTNIISVRYRKELQLHAVESVFINILLVH